MALGSLTTVLAGYGQAVPALGAVLVVVAGLAAIGSLVSGRRGDPAAWVTTGWGVACLGSLAATFPSLSLSMIAPGLVVLALAGGVVTWRRGGPFLPASTWRLLILAAPLLLMAAAMRPSQWDEFSHWLLAGEYLLQVDRFPGPGLPLPIQDYPAYPYGVPLIHYLVGRLAGGLVESAGPIFNTLLLVLAADPIIRAARRDLDGVSLPNWAWCGFGVLAVTALSPTFVLKIVFTNYADTAQSVAFTFFALSVWRMVREAEAGSPGATWAAARQAAFSGIALVQAKPTGLVLAAAVLMGGGVVALANGAWRRPVRPLVQAAFIVALIAVADLRWETYIAANLPQGRQPILPPSQWDISILHDALVSIAHVISNKGGYFGLMAVILVLAVWRLRRAGQGINGLYLLAATAFLGHTLFLVVAYVAIFGGYEGRNAASFWRYNMAFGPLAMILAADAGTALWARLPAGKERVAKGLARLAVVLPLAMGVVAQPWLRFDMVLPKADFRRIAPEMLALLPDDSRLFVIDPLENGFYAKMARFLMRKKARLVGDSNVFNAASFGPQMAKTHPTALWVHTADPQTEAALGLSLPAGASYLLLKDGDGWRMVGSWPFSGYRWPHDVDKG